MIHLSSDFTKLIRFIIQQSSVYNQAVNVKESIQKVDETGEGSLANVCINLFTHYVVNESGKSVEDML